MVIDQPATATELAAGLNLTVDVVEACWRTCNGSITAILLMPRMWTMPASQQLCWLQLHPPGF